MSRIGNKPINVPDGVTIDLKGNSISIKGPKGTLKRELNSNAKVEVVDSQIIVSRLAKARHYGAYQGLVRALINNMVIGVTTGFEKKMQVEGVGYRVSLQGKKLVLNIGYSSPKEYDLPAGVEAVVGDKGLNFSIMGLDKELVGQTAATIRRFRKPEPYKGKGIRYADERIRRKAGKAGVK